ncbi:hypothetical protein LCGC14_1244040 [marine sediment metagenome]|uniref:Uncharacterized protein n=1 Tax=marine sediment metagenome TaxID=412755 RepID=A0A0F9L515_9ZZZZ
MAKVTGPLFSVSASGKIADAIVFFSWKGRNVVRQWLKPSNPMTADQGDIRLIIGALGRACSPIHTTSVVATDVRLFAATGATWVSEIVKYMIDNVINDGTAWDALVTEYEAHTATADFDTEAAALNLAQLDIPYKGAADLAEPGAILYLIAKCLSNWELLGTKGFQRTPYTTALASWALAQIQAMVAEFAAA